MRLVAILKNSLFYTFASTLQGLVSFLLLPIYTKYLFPSDYAILALVTSFTSIVSTIITLQVHTGIPRFINKFLKDADRAKVYFSSIFILLFVILFFSCLMINVFGESIIKILFSDKEGISYSPYFMIATWTLLPNLLIISGLQLLQTLEKGGAFFLVTFIQVIINVCFGVFFVVFVKTGVIGVLYAQIISAIFGLVFIIWLIRGWLKFIVPRLSQDIKNSLRYSIPMIPHMLGIYIYMYSDRIILQHFVPLSQIGIYSIADTFAYILLIIINATTAAYNFHFFRVAEQDKIKAQKETKRFIEIWWIGIMIIFMGYLLLSGYVVKFMTRPSFYPSIPLIPILAIAYIFRGLYCFSANSIFFVEKTKVIPIITVTAALINIAFNLILIPKYGIYAAAWTTVISYLITFILAYLFSKKYYFIQFPWRNMLKVSCFLIIIYFVSKISEKIIPTVIFLRFSFNILLFLLFGVCVFLYLQHNTVFSLRRLLKEIRQEKI